LPQKNVLLYIKDILKKETDESLIKYVMTTYGIRDQAHFEQLLKEFEEKPIGIEYIQSLNKWL